MKKLLQKQDREIYFYLNNEKKIIDRNNRTTYPVNISGDISRLYGNISSELYGDISGLSGDISELYGDISELYGDISELSGDITGLTGDITGLTGNINNCEITDGERKAGVNIQDLINL